MTGIGVRSDYASFVRSWNLSDDNPWIWRHGMASNCSSCCCSRSLRRWTGCGLDPHYSAPKIHQNLELIPVNLEELEVKKWKCYQRSLMEDQRIKKFKKSNNYLSIPQVFNEPIFNFYYFKFNF